MSSVLVAMCRYMYVDQHQVIHNQVIHNQPIHYQPIRCDCEARTRRRVHEINQTLSTST